MGFDQLLEQQPQHHSGQGCDDQVQRESLRECAIGDPRKGRRESRAVLPADRKDGTRLNNDIENLGDGVGKI